MEIKKFDSIVSEGNEKFKNMFEVFSNDIKEMASSNQLNINSMEETMLTLLGNVKNIITSTSEKFLSNVKNENSSKILKYKGESLKLVKKNSKIIISTLLGKLKITRNYYFSRSKSIGIGEIDALLGIPTSHKMTKGLIEAITYAGQKESSFKEGQETLKRYLNLDVSCTQIQTISEEVGKLLFDNDMEEATQIYDKVEGVFNYNDVYKKDHDGLTNKTSTLYIFADGSMLNMRGKDNWKEIKLGLVVSEDDISIKSADNMVLDKKIYVSYLGNKDIFKKLLFAAAVKAGYNGNTKVIAIADGAPWIWNMFEELFPGCTKILDFYHFSENVYSYANFFYPEDEIGRKKWVDNIFKLTNANKIDEVLDEIKKINGLEIKSPKNLVNLYDYILERRNMINYTEFKKRGYIIGSGAIESGNKAVIQKRLKQSGMRWSKEGAQYIANLRTKYNSDLWYKVIRCIDEEYVAA